MAQENKQSRFAESLFHSFVENAEDYAIFAMDRDGRIVHWNKGAAQITGYAEADVLGHALREVFTPEDIEAGVPEHELATAAELGRAADERWHIRKDGSRFWALGLVMPIRGEDGDIIGYGKILRDRTDLKQMQEALQRRNEMLLHADEGKNRFLATLAHELRNPLSVLANSLRLLRHHCGERTQTDAERVRTELDRLDRQLRQMQRLVDDLADLARANTDKMRLDKQPLDLRAAAKQALDALKTLLEERKHAHSLILPDTPVMIAGDPARIQQILVNLLTNAARYTAPGGQVGLTLSAEGNEGVVRVFDSGVGIPPERLADIFELFTQAHTDHSETQAGLGIGLALVRELVALHGGTIQAHSEGAGKGSEFTVRFPLLEGLRV